MEASVAGTNSTSSHASQPSGTRPNLPAGPPVDCERPKITTSAGTANRLAWPARSKSSVAGCRRCSDGIAGFRWEQVVADGERAAVLEAFELHLGVVGAGCVDHERAEAEAALDRALRDVDVLDPRARHVDHHAPVDAFADLETLLVHAVRRVLIRDRRPAI